MRDVVTLFTVFKTFSIKIVNPLFVCCALVLQSLPKTIFQPAKPLDHKKLIAWKATVSNQLPQHCWQGQWCWYMITLVQTHVTLYLFIYTCHFYCNLVLINLCYSDCFLSFYEKLLFSLLCFYVHIWCTTNWPLGTNNVEFEWSQLLMLSNTSNTSWHFSGKQGENKKKIVCFFNVLPFNTSINQSIIWIVLFSIENSISFNISWNNPTLT